MYIRKTSEELHYQADKIAATITIRGEVNGTAQDVTRKTTPAERRELHRIAYSALFTANWDRNPRDRAAQIRTLCDMAEAMCLDWRLRPTDPHDDDAHVNGYDTVYCPLYAYLMNWPEE